MSDSDHAHPDRSDAAGLDRAHHLREALPALRVSRRLLGALLVALFVSETAVMFFLPALLSLLPPLPAWFVNCVDAGLLAFVMLPISYLLVFRAMARQIAALDQERALSWEKHERMRTREALHRSLFERAPISVLLIDPATTLPIEFNDMACRQLGYSREEFARLRITDYEAAENPAETRMHIDKILREGGDEFGTRHRTKGGDIRDVLVTAWTIESSGRTLFHCVFRDITDILEAENRVRELASIIEATPEGIVTTGVDGVVKFVNPGWEKMTGWASREVVGKASPRILKSGRNDPALYERLWRTITQGQSFWCELKNRRKDGTLYEVESIITPLKDATGRITGYAGIERDITERKRAEKVLRESETRYRSLFENMLHGFAHCKMLFDDQERPADFIYLDVNGTFTRLTGLKDVVGKRVSEVLPGILELSPELCETYGRVALTGEPARFEFEFKSQGKWLAISVYSPAKGYFVALFDDITERKIAAQEKARLEAQLIQSQKMEAIGRLAGGVAHDFNNLLTAISGYSDFLLGSVASDDPRREDVKEIKKAGERAASLTRQLLAFSRKQVLQPTVLDLNSVAIDTQKMLARLIGEDIVLTVVLSKECVRVRADQGHLEQVILNLAVNAKDAMTKGGKLTIETSPVRLDEAYAHKHGTIERGSYVMLTVSDTGCGMNAEVQSHLFEPFFTTKERGKGTGLGLSTVYGIVTQSGGRIAVYSEEGRGTVFKVYLPEVKDALDAGGQPAPAQESLFQGPGTILLVEDETSVRTLTSRILIQAGFTVIEAENGEAALSLCQRHEGTIHLMLTDMVMPKMSGPELAGCLSSLRPEMKVVYMSGYTEHSVLESELLELTKSFIQKPFSPGALVQKIRETLTPS